MNQEFDYFFQFDSEAQARADPVVGPYFSTAVYTGQNEITTLGGTAIVTDSGFMILTDGTNTGKTVPSNMRLNIWPFDLTQTASPPKGWWCMSPQGAQIATFASHANLKYFLTVPGDILFKATPNVNSGNDFTVVAYATGKAVYAENWAVTP
jgi:hypothetical protein